MAAVTQYERRDEGFLALGSYFDGANEEGLLLTESQPLVMTYYPDVLPAPMKGNIYNIK